MSFKDNLFNLKIAERGLQLAKDRRSFAVVDRLARKTREGTLGSPDDEPLDELGVSVGNTVSNYYGRRPAGWLKTAAIAVGLLAGGLAGGGIGAWLAGAFDRALPPPPADQEQQFEVRFYDSAGRLIDVPRLPEDKSGKLNRGE